MPSVIDAVWLRPRLAEPSESPAKFVNDRLGGPQLTGSCDGPRMPSAAETSAVYAKYGSAALRLRLKLKLRLLLKRGLKLWFQPRPVLHPLPPFESWKPNSIWLAPWFRLYCWLTLIRSLRVSGRLKRMPRLSLLLGIDVTSW